MKRYMTTRDENGNINVFTEDENWQDAQNEREEYIWQFAESKEQASARHCAAHDKWFADSQADKPLKNTY